MGYSGRRRKTVWAGGGRVGVIDCSFGSSPKGSPSLSFFGRRETRCAKVASERTMTHQPELLLRSSGVLFLCSISWGNIIVPDSSSCLIDVDFPMTRLAKNGMTDPNKSLNYHRPSPCTLCLRPSGCRNSLFATAPMASSLPHALSGCSSFSLLELISLSYGAS